MAIMKKILLILFMLVTGCATEQKYIDYQLGSNWVSEK